MQNFANLISQYEHLVFSICFSFTKNYFDAEDLAQETFISAYRSMDQFDGSNLSAWLTTIAANKCRDYLKSPAKKRTKPAQPDLEVLADYSHSPEPLTLAKTEEEKVAALCNRLKEPYQTVATQYFVQDKKLSEVAKQSGQNLKTLQTQLYRAKKQLAALWKEECTDG